MKKSWLRFAAERMYWDPGETGLSSNAMVREAVFGVPMEDTWNYPHDFADLWRCRLAYRRAPLSLKRKMLPRLQEFRKHVWARQSLTMIPPAPVPTYLQRNPDGGWWIYPKSAAAALWRCEISEDEYLAGLFYHPDPALYHQEYERLRSEGSIA